MTCAFDNVDFHVIALKVKFKYVYGNEEMRIKGHL